MFSLLKQNKSHKPIEFNFLVNLTGVTSLEKTDPPSPSNYKMPIFSQLWVGLHAHLPPSPHTHLIKFCLDWACCANAVGFSSYVQLPCWVWKHCCFLLSSTISGSYSLWEDHPELWKEGCSIDVPFKMSTLLSLFLCTLTNCGLLC